MAGWLQLALTVSGSTNADALNFDEIGPLLQSAAGDQGYVSSILIGDGGANAAYLPSAASQSSSETTETITDWIAVFQQASTATHPAVVTVTAYFANATSGIVDIVKILGATPRVIGALGLAAPGQATSSRIVKLTFTTNGTNDQVNGRAWCVRSAS